MNGRISLGLSLAALAWAALAVPAAAQDSIKIGYLSSFSGPLGHLGEEIRDGFMLGVAGSDGKLGGLATEFVIADDQSKPDIARQLADKLIEQDRVDLITGVATSAVILSIVKPVTESGRVLISTVAGPSQLAGKGCNPNFFVMGLQNDLSAQIVGQAMQQQGIKRVYLMAADYAAGKDKLAGFKRGFKGEIVGEVYTPFTQLDFAAELAQVRNAKPDAIFVFYSGDFGINFVKQYHQAGLDASIALYGDIGTFDEIIIGATGDASLGGQTATFWSREMSNAANVKFVADFNKKYGRLPSYYAAFGYDTARMLDAALRASGGKVKDQTAFRKALENVKFDSVRGDFHFDKNHEPLYDWYYGKVVKDSQGNGVLKNFDKVATMPSDPFVGQCPMAQN